MVPRSISPAILAVFIQCCGDGLGGILLITDVSGTSIFQSAAGKPVSGSCMGGIVAITLIVTTGIDRLSAKPHCYLPHHHRNNHRRNDRPEKNEIEPFRIFLAAHFPSPSCKASSAICCAYFWTFFSSNDLMRRSAVISASKSSMTHSTARS